MFEFRAAEKLREQISLWKVAAMEGKSDREKRQADRSKASDTSVQWKHLLVKVDEHGAMLADDNAVVEHAAKRWSEGQGLSAEDVAETLKEINAADGLEEVSDRDVSPTYVKLTSGSNVNLTSEKKRAIRRRTLVDYMLRDGVPVDDAKPDAAGGAAAKTRHMGEVVTAHVYVEEEDDAAAADHDIIAMMLAELCKYKHSLTRAFVACEHEEAEKAEKASQAAASSAATDAHGPSRASLLRRSSKISTRTVPYAKWLTIISTYMPEFDISLWSEYGPRIVGNHAVPPIPPGAKPSDNTSVAYLAWLGRFQVDLVFDTSGKSFFSSVLERLYTRLLARTKRMPMAELFAHFDPNQDGGVERSELTDALRALDLGLSKPQLEQLVINLNIDEHKDSVSPIQAITLLLEKIGARVRAARRKRLLATLASGGDTPSHLTPEREAHMEAKRIELGQVIRGNMQATVKALGSSAVQAIFQKADADGAPATNTRTHHARTHLRPHLRPPPKTPLDTHPPCAASPLRRQRRALPHRGDRPPHGAAGRERVGPLRERER